MTLKSFWCQLCREHIEHEVANDDVYEGIAAGMDHFRVMHPDVEIATWPDGAAVVVDQSLQPEDFEGAA